MLGREWPRNLKIREFVISVRVMVAVQAAKPSSTAILNVDMGIVYYICSLNIGLETTRYIQFQQLCVCYLCDRQTSINDGTL